MKKHINNIISFIIIIAMAYGIYIYRDMLIPKQTEIKEEIATTKVKQGKFSANIKESGLCKSKKSLIITSPFRGVVTKICENDVDVKKGDILVEFDKTDIEKQVSEAETAYEQALVDEKQIEEEIKILQKSSALEVKSMVSRQKFNIRELETAKNNLDRQERLYSEKIVSFKEVESVQSNLRAKQSTVEEGELRIETAKKKSITISAEKNTELLIKKKMTEKAKEDYNVLKANLLALSVVSPINGTCILLSTSKSSNDQYGPVIQGESVGAGEILMEICDNSNIIINSIVREININKVKIGQTVSITIPSKKDNIFKGKIKDIELGKKISSSSPLASRTQSAWNIIIELPDNKDNILKSGMQVECEFITEELPNAIFIPFNAVFMDGDISYVWLKTDNNFTKIVVETGIKNDENIVITSGLKKDDIIALTEPFNQEKSK